MLIQRQEQEIDKISKFGPKNLCSRACTEPQDYYLDEWINQDGVDGKQ